MIRSLELSTISPFLWEEERGLGIELMVNHASVRKNPQSTEFGELPGWSVDTQAGGHIHVPGG